METTHESFYQGTLSLGHRVFFYPFHTAFWVRTCDSNSSVIVVVAVEVIHNLHAIDFVLLALFWESG